MKLKKKIFLELILIISSVFIFRGLWELLDKIYFANSVIFLVISLFLGIFFTIVILNIFFKELKNKVF